MPATNPYQAWFDAVLTALRTLVTNPDQVELWVDRSDDELLPSKRLEEAVSRTLPKILVAWGRGSLDDRALGGSIAGEETVYFTVHFGCGAPRGGGDLYPALTGDGSPYMGAFEFYHLIKQKIRAVAVVGWMGPAKLPNSAIFEIEGKGAIRGEMNWQISRADVIAD